MQKQKLVEPRLNMYIYRRYVLVSFKHFFSFQFTYFNKILSDLVTYIFYNFKNSLNINICYVFYFFS